MMPPLKLNGDASSSCPTGSAAAELVNSRPGAREKRIGYSWKQPMGVAPGMLAPVAPAVESVAAEPVAAVSANAALVDEGRLGAEYTPQYKQLPPLARPSL